MATRTVNLSSLGPITETPKSWGWHIIELINDLVASVNEMRTDHLGTGTSYQVLLTELVADHATQKVTTDLLVSYVDELVDDHATQKVTTDLLVAAVDELIVDHGTQKVTTDLLVAAVDELIVDHGTQKVTTDLLVAAVDELIVDHGTQKVTTDLLVAAVDELALDHAIGITWDTEVESDLDDLADYFDFLWEADGIRSGEFTMASAAATTIAVTTQAGIAWTRGGQRHYRKTLPTTLTLEDSGDIADTKFGAWRVLMDDLGAITTQDTGAQMAFANAEDAMLNLSHETPTANTITIGYYVLENAQGGSTAFNIGTTNTNAAGVNSTFYYEMGPRKQMTGLTAALGSSVVADSGASTWSSGTIDFQALGLDLAQIGAITNQAVDDADTIAAGEAGGWLLCTDYAQTGVYLLASDGVAGSVSALTDTDAAGALTAIGTLCDQLPGLFCPMGWIIVVNGSGGTFTAGSTNWNAADITTTVDDATVGVWDRTSLTGFDSHKINPPAVPANVASPLIGTLSATTPITAGPAALTATTGITAGPAALTATTGITAGPAALTATTGITAGPATLSATASITPGPDTLSESVPAAHSSAAVDDLSTKELGAP